MYGTSLVHNYFSEEGEYEEDMIAEESEEQTEEQKDEEKGKYDEIE